MTLGLGLWSGGGGREYSFLFLAALAGEIAAGIALFLFLDTKVFRPAEEYLRELEDPSENGPPLCGGVLEPVAAGVSGRIRNNFV